MSDFFFSDCFCEQDRKMSKHVMIYYIKHLKKCKKLKIDRQMNLRKMIFSHEKLQKNSMITEAESVFSVLASSEAEKVWSVDE